jgi:hypothetical protein
MEILKYFFECPFNQGEGFDVLDEIIQHFKQREKPECQFKFITELHSIINTSGYVHAQKVINKYGYRTLSLEKTEKIIKYLYDKLTDTPTDVKGIDFRKKFKGVFCPICTPNVNKATAFSFIDKATIIQNNQQIYICKLCKFVWFSENKIKAANATPYKKFMRTLGLKGLWKELSDVDVL